MPIVVLPREYGSGGTNIFMKVAERLGYEYIRDQITKEAAEAFGVAEDGPATLKGLVFSGAAKDNAEIIVKRVAGVRSVENQIRVYKEW